jgi:hypothetical protein
MSNLQSLHLALLGEIESWKHLVVADCWYTCAAATEEREGEETCDDERRGEKCDCGLDKRRDKIKELLERYG